MDRARMSHRSSQGAQRREGPTASRPERCGQAGLGVPRQPSALDLPPRRSALGPVVRHGVVLKAVGTDFVAPHPRANLRPTLGGLSAVKFAAPMGQHAPLQFRKGLGLAVLARPALRLRRKARGRVEGSARVLVLVPVLAALAGSGEPFKAHFGRVERRSLALRREYRDSDRRCVNPASPLGWRDALEAVASSFSLPAVKWRVDSERKATVAAFALDGLSAVGARPAQIALGQHINQQSGVFATLSGADFNVDHAADSTRKTPLTQAQNPDRTASVAARDMGSRVASGQLRAALK
jgi:hypothetical protein